LTLAGPLTAARNPIATVVDFKDAIVHFLTTGAHAGVDLGPNHDLFQFLPALRRDGKFTALLTNYPYLRRTPGMEDIVVYVQGINIERAKKAFGPTELPIYFNF
jgi:hypothetical protein